MNKKRRIVRERHGIVRAIVEVRSVVKVRRTDEEIDALDRTLALLLLHVMGL